MLSLPLPWESRLLLLLVQIIEVANQLVGELLRVEYPYLSLLTFEILSMQGPESYDFVLSASWEIQTNQFFRLLSWREYYVVFLQNIGVQVTHQWRLFPRLGFPIPLPECLWLSHLLNFLLRFFRSIGSECFSNPCVNDHFSLLI